MTAPIPADWHTAYEPGVPHDLPPTDRLFDGILAAAAGSAPGYPALEFFQRRLRYAELEAAVARAAAAFQRQGVRPGEPIVLMLPNCPSFVIAVLGALRAGAVVAPLDPRADRAGLRRWIARVAPRAAIVAPGLAPELADALAASGGELVIANPADDMAPSLRLIHRLSSRGRGASVRRPSAGLRWAAWLREAAAEPEPSGIDPDAPALYLAPEPGDTAGARDGTVLSHRQLVAGALQLRLWLTDAMPGDGTWLLLAPLASAFGFVTGLGAAMLLRDRLALLADWPPDDVEDALRCLRPTYVASDGPALTQLVAAPALARLRQHSVRAWLTGTPLDVDTVSTFEGVSGISLCLGYAPPGVAGLATCNPINGRRAAGSIGVPLPGNAARLVSAAGRGGASEGLELAGPNVAVGPGILGGPAPVAPNGPGDSDGSWMATSNPARIDSLGFIYLLDAPPAQDLIG